MASTAPSSPNPLPRPFSAMGSSLALLRPKSAAISKPRPIVPMTTGEVETITRSLEAVARDAGDAQKAKTVSIEKLKDVKKSVDFARSLLHVCDDVQGTIWLLSGGLTLCENAKPESIKKKSPCSATRLQSGGRK